MFLAEINRLRRVGEDEAPRAGDQQPAATARAADADTGEAPPTPATDNRELEEMPDEMDAETAAQMVEYMRMLQCGIPVESVRFKVAIDGFDVALFEEVLGAHAMDIAYRPPYHAETQTQPRAALPPTVGDGSDIAEMEQWLENLALIDTFVGNQVRR